MGERGMAQLLNCDFSVGTEAFREDLLKRCLAVLGADDGGICLADEDLEMLAAAGEGLMGENPRQWDAQGRGCGILT